MPTYNPLSSYGYNARAISPEQQAALDAAKQRQLTTLPTLAEQARAISYGQANQGGYQQALTNGAVNAPVAPSSGQLDYTPGAGDPNDPLVNDPVYGWGTRSQIERLKAQIAATGNTPYTPPPAYAPPSNVPQGTSPDAAPNSAPSSRSIVPPHSAPPVYGTPTATPSPAPAPAQITPWTQPRSKTLAYWIRPSYTR